MPRRRRPVRQVRRPNFQPAPEPSESEEDDAAREEPSPTFADEPAVAMPAGYGASGPVETRPHWVSRDQRAQGRRIAQLRRSSREDRVTPRAGGSGQLPTFASGYIAGEVRQITITTLVMVVTLVVLAVVLR